MSGRKYYDRGEKFAYDILSVTTRAARPDGERLFRESSSSGPDGARRRRSES